MARQQAERQREHLNISEKTEVEIRELMIFCRSIASEQPKAALDLLEAIYEIHNRNEGLAEVLSEVLTLRSELSKQSAPAGD